MACTHRPYFFPRHVRFPSPPSRVFLLRALGFFLFKHQVFFWFRPYFCSAFFLHFTVPRSATNGEVHFPFLIFRPPLLIFLTDLERKSSPSVEWPVFLIEGTPFDCPINVRFPPLPPPTHFTSFTWPSLPCFLVAHPFRLYADVFCQRSFHTTRSWAFLPFFKRFLRESV